MWDNNNNNNLAFRSPVVRYTAQYGDARFRNAPYYRSTPPGYLLKSGIPRGLNAPLCPGLTGRMLLWTLVGCVILMTVIGTIIGVMMTIDKGSANSNSTTITTPPPTSVSPLNLTSPSINPSASASQATSSNPQTNTSSSSNQPVTGSTPSQIIITSVPNSNSSQSVSTISGQTQSSNQPGSSGSSVTIISSTVNASVSFSEGSSTSQSAASPASVSGSTAGSKASTGPAQTGSTASGGTSVSGVTGTTVAQQTTGSEVNSPTTRSIETTASSTTRPPLVFCPNISRVLIYSRPDSTAQFNRTWSEMRSGFGSENSSYWKGLDDISTLSLTGKFGLRVYYESLATGGMFMAEYTTFKVDTESTGYQLTVDNFSANFTGNAFQKYSGYKFQTYDRPPNPPGSNCALESGGGWWFGDSQCTCGACLTQAERNGFVWMAGFTTTSLKRAKMELYCL